jgi:hypothetical protein
MVAGSRIWFLSCGSRGKPLVWMRARWLFAGGSIARGERVKFLTQPQEASIDLSPHLGAPCYCTLIKGLPAGGAEDQLVQSRLHFSGSAKGYNGRVLMGCRK